MPSLLLPLFQRTIVTPRPHENNESEISSPSIPQLGIPKPRYRHATPSGPWPFLDLGDLVPDELTDANDSPKDNKCKHALRWKECDICWDEYPQSLYPNWTQFQQEKSRIYDVTKRNHRCTLHHVEMALDDESRLFSMPVDIVVDVGNRNRSWALLRQLREKRVRMRAIFVDSISGPALKMLGTLYNIEPFFFSSSLGWTPSRYRESYDPIKKRDHITLTLRFIRKLSNTTASGESACSNLKPPCPKNEKQIIDVHEPLVLSTYTLHPDLLSLHMLRSETETVIISYHAHDTYGSTSAQQLCHRLRQVGRSVYWNKMLGKTNDPTFVLISILWYALYAWDEALESLYSHICKLETKAMGLESIEFTRELHIIRAHLLHYASLLLDFKKAVKFIEETPNPVMDYDHNEDLKATLHKECKYLLTEIGRLEEAREMQDQRLKNVMNLCVSQMSIGDSKQMHSLTKATLRDSAAIKQISYLTMVFLPASFTAAIFGMNVMEINPDGHGSLRQFFAAALPLTVVTVWIIGAMQLPNEIQRPSDLRHVNAPYEDDNTYRWSRLWWPVILVQTRLADRIENQRLRGLTESNRDQT
ncbi:hypothetical protein AMATHDRAFT_181098 [Amanita thiersii Skay4041]|uniref:Uncharacterized protein n=1 Tax=Amanita thiersii Skay4041 TaxID=703135 RepID=A0A2A9NIE9_9AGAR|nr:hypothetical protein AMATHDRAFT_181098 [Amanita thiersii Skay4041]